MYLRVGMHVCVCIVLVNVFVCACGNSGWVMMKVSLQLLKLQLQQHQDDMHVCKPADEQAQGHEQAQRLKRLAHQRLLHRTTHAQGTGMAIYFPQTRASYDYYYDRFVTAFPTAMTDWDNFLNALYNLGESIASDISSSERSTSGGCLCVRLSLHVCCYVMCASVYAHVRTRSVCMCAP